MLVNARYIHDLFSSLRLKSSLYFKNEPVTNSALTSAQENKLSELAATKETKANPSDQTIYIIDDFAGVYTYLDILRPYFLVIVPVDISLIECRLES